MGISGFLLRTFGLMFTMWAGVLLVGDNYVGTIVCALLGGISIEIGYILRNKKWDD